MGKLAYDLGNIYRQVGIEPPNSSALFYILQHPVDEWKAFLETETAIHAFRQTLEAIDQACQGLSRSTPQTGDREILLREFKQTMALLKHACMRGLFIYNSGDYSAKFLSDDLDKIIEEYQQVWLLRNRPGGLKDSLSHFSLTKNAYQ